MINRLLTFSLFVFLSFTVSAQTFSYTLIDEPIVNLECVLDTDVDTVIHGTIANLMNEGNELVWHRNIIYLPQGWTSFVCDPFLCYGPSTGQREMDLTPNQSGAFDLHLHTNGHPGDSAIIEMCIFHTEDTTQLICHTYKFYCDFVSNESVVLNELSVFPNPATDFIQINIPYFGQIDKVQIELININGQVLKSTYATGNVISISTSGLPTGSYIVRVFSDLGVVNRRVMLR